MTTVTIPDGNMDKTRALAERIGVDEETAYAMMLMTALLMDLRPGDERVCEMIAKDCEMIAKDCEMIAKDCEHVGSV